ncbi:MAG TPA: phosphatase PAP2 family protein [Candidatus Sulfotelmatobacter sp.]|nr:phosphatase PAP2 family protein [Candidatus Sulfotelmatobacter sp.]
MRAGPTGNNQFSHENQINIVIDGIIGGTPVRGANLGRWVLSVAAVVCLLWIGSQQTFFKDTISSPFLAVALLSIFLIQLRTKVEVRELALAGILAFALYGLDIRWLGYALRWPALVSFVGMASLVVLGLRVIWAEAPERGTAILTLVPAFLFVASEWCASYFLEWGARARPTVLDLFLYSFDASLRVQPAFLMGQLFARFPNFAAGSVIVYLALPVAIGLTFAGCVRRDRGNAVSAVVAFLITGPIGACFYTIFPALGPAHIFQKGFPWSALTVEQARNLFLEPLAVAGPRNAIPSLHAAWIFLVFWYARKLSLVERLVAGGFVFFTLCATMGTGEHYLVDLIVAVPFTVMILGVTQIVCAREQRTPWGAVLYGLGMTLLWFGLLRYGNRVFWASALVPWVACALTIVSGWYYAGELGQQCSARELGSAEARLA